VERAHDRRDGPSGTGHEHRARRRLALVQLVPPRLRRAGRPHVGLLAVRLEPPEHDGPPRPRVVRTRHLLARQ
jgi:hypothetical protein